MFATPIRATFEAGVDPRAVPEIRGHAAMRFAMSPECATHEWRIARVGAWSPTLPNEPHAGGRTRAGRLRACSVPAPHRVCLQSTAFYNFSL